MAEAAEVEPSEVPDAAEHKKFAAAPARPETARTQRSEASVGLEAAAPRHNVIILLADDVGVDMVGAYKVADASPPTPNIDALAKNGVMFRHAWSNPSCSPTRACIQTGRYSFRTGVGTASISRGGVLRPEETTIPELLDKAETGHAHAAFGKWHLSDRRNGGKRSPNLAGWSHYAGSINGVTNYYRWWRTVNGVTEKSTVYNTTQTVDDALAWIRSAPEPWVCYVAFPAAHSPFHIPPAALHTYPVEELVPARPKEGKAPAQGGGADPGRKLTPAEIRKLANKVLSGKRIKRGKRVVAVPSHERAQYKAMVQALDTEIGRLMSGLGGRRERTDVIFMGDNGTPVGHAMPPFSLARAKHTPYQGGVQVPLIVSGPSVREPGRAVDEMVGAVDVFATVAEICGADPQLAGPIDGISMVPYLRVPGQAPLRRTLLAENFLGAAKTSPTSYYAFRDERYKLTYVSFQTPAFEFYDLLEDPYEKNDLLSGELTPALRTRYESLKKAVTELRNQAPDLAASSQEPALTKRQKRRLERKRRKKKRR